MKTIVVLLLTLSASLNALAHSKLTASTPGQGEVLEVAPETIALTFGADIRLTQVTVKHDSGETMKLLKTVPTDLKREFSMPAAIQDKGKYVLNWRGLGEDGHAMKGRFSFEIR